VKELREARASASSAMGVSGGAKAPWRGQAGARRHKRPTTRSKHLVRKMAAQVEDGPCVTYIRPVARALVKRTCTTA